MGDVATVRNATPFIGRAPELGRLRELLKGTAAGSPAAVLLAGDAGVGKTSLATEFGRFARESGAIVLTGRNVDLGSGGLPYLPFSEALAQVLREGRPDSAHGGPAADRAAAARDVVLTIASMRPGLSRLIGRDEPLPAKRTAGDADLDRLALFEAVSEALVRISATVAPMVVVVEDLHWAEQSTRDLLRFLLTRLGNDPLMFVATYRADDLHRRHPLRPLLAELVRLPAVERMELHPFDDAELTAFLDAIHGSQVPASVVRKIGERSSGNAYFAEELFSAGSGAGRLPTALADVLIDRLERLKPATQQLMRVASVIGAFRIEDVLLRAAAIDGAALSRPDADDALRDAVAHQVLVADDTDRFGFRHALLQEAVYSDLLPGERVRLHGVVARLLGERDAVPHTGRADSADRADGADGADGAKSDRGGGDAAEQARHSLAAHDLPQALSASLRAAAAATQRLAPAEALSQYEQALQLWDSVPPDRRPPGADLVTTSLAAAEAAGNAGLRERAVALAEAAATAASKDAESGPEPVRDARSALAIHLYAMDQLPELVAVARSVIESYPGAATSSVACEPTRALVRTRAILARALFSLGETERAMDVVRPGLAEARNLDLRAEEADLQMTWSSVDGMLGRPEFAAHLQLARDAAEASGDPGIMMRVAYSGLIDRFEEGDLAGVLGLVRESMALADRAGLSNSLYATQCRWILVTAHWMMGDPEAAMAAVLEGCRDLPTFGSRQLQHAALPILAARAPEEALQWVHDLEIVRTNPWDAPQRWAATAEAHQWLGDLSRSLECSDRAIETLDSLYEPYTLMGISFDVNAAAVAADIAAATRSAGDPARDGAADDAVRRGQRFVADARERGAKGRPRRFRMGPEGLAWLARLEAEAARLTGDDTVAQWETAVAAFGFGAVFEQARCRWRLAQRLLAEGRRDDARTVVAQARSTAVSLGAQPLLAALDDLARRGRLTSHSGPVAGGQLTPRERDVMRLVAQGLTNRAIGERLFISEKTASVHVSNVLTKLGASGRAEAVAIATRDDLL